VSETALVYKWIYLRTGAGPQRMGSSDQPLAPTVTENEIEIEGQQPRRGRWDHGTSKERLIPRGCDWTCLGAPTQANCALTAAGRSSGACRRAAAAAVLATACATTSSMRHAPCAIRGRSGTLNAMHRKRLRRWDTSMAMDLLSSGIGRPGLHRVWRARSSRH
jgi:hypothetical protein